MADKYVATTGSDGAAGSIGAPYLTIAHGLSIIAAGDTLWVRGGTYNTNITSVPNGTAWGNKARCAAYLGETVWLIPTSASAGSHVIWLDGNFHYFEFDGINTDGTSSDQAGLWVSTNNYNNPHHIRFQNAEVIAGDQGAGAAIDLGAHTIVSSPGGNEIINCVIHGGGLPGLCGFACASYGVYLKGPNNLVENCVMYDTSGAGVQIYNAGGDAPDNNIVRNNIIRDISRTGDMDQVWGIIVVGANNQIYNNVIHGITAGNTTSSNAGILVGDGQNGNLIYNNTVTGNTNTGIFIGTGSANAVKNNIIYNNTGTAFIDNGSGTLTGNNLTSNPAFVNAGADDYRLQAGSAAINAGVDLAEVTTDLLGSARPAGLYDIGAYEVTAFTPSDSGTRVPPYSSITDDMGAVWTLGPGTSPFLEILRNGVNSQEGAYAGIILWLGDEIYVRGDDDVTWYLWNGLYFEFYSTTEPTEDVGHGATYYYANADTGRYCTC